MQVTPTNIQDVLLVEPTVFSDERGFFRESYNQQRFRDKAGLTLNFVQDNHSGSQQNVLRGLHYQIQQPQGKLIQVIVGTVFDVSVDLRRSSPSFGKWVGQVLSAENRKQLWIPPGFAHGFYVLSAWAEIVYKTTEYYAPQHERTLLWNDPDLAIVWPLSQLSPLLSAKDRAGLPLKAIEVFE
jgi:dTDP-4-dehydrorhamnose 3,5-epimerase